MTMLAVWASVLTASVLTIAEHRTVRLIALGVQYVVVAWLSSLAIPGQVAAVKLVGGLIACGILGLTSAAEHHASVDRPQSSRTRFRAVASVLVLVAAFGVGGGNWMEIPEISAAANLGATVLIAMGLLQVGLARHAFGACLGLMTFLAGFEVAYSVIEPALAVLALLASVHIGLALVVSYLMLLTGNQEPSW